MTLLLVLGLAPLLTAADRSPAIVYFYSSETNINNFASLKTEFDTYLGGFGGYHFQPFQRREDFEKFVAEAPGGLLLVSSWHFRLLKGRLAIQPVLVGTIGEHAAQKRVLVAGQGIADLSGLRGQLVASAGNQEYTRTMLRQMAGASRDELTASFKILVVPKDIDALMAVSFGAAKAALTTESSLDRLAQINPRQQKLLTSLLVSDDVLLPVLAIGDDSGAGQQQLVGVMAEMGDNPEGRARLKMLGFDRLRRLEMREKEDLLR